MGAIEVLLLITTLLAVLGLLPPALSQLRTTLIQNGLDTPDERLAKQARKSQIAQVTAVLQGIGIDDRASTEIRASLFSSRRVLSRLLKRYDEREDVLFLALAQSSIYELEPPRSYKKSKYYLDIMGAMSRNEKDCLSLDQIFERWISRAAVAGEMNGFDAFLAPKDGNVTLCQAVAKRFKKPLILCKGESDRARVDRPDMEEPHETDFEGLRSFMTRAEERTTTNGRSYSFCIIDDSCSGGSQIASIATRFNRWLTANSGTTGWKADSITRCFVLFRATARGNVSNERLESAGVQLNALVSLGENELKLLQTMKLTKILKNLETFKKDIFACQTSIATLGCDVSPNGATTGISHRRADQGSEPSGTDKAPCDVVGQVAGLSDGSAEASEQTDDGF